MRAIACFILLPEPVRESPNQGSVRREINPPGLAPNLSAFLGEFLKERHGREVVFSSAGVFGGRETVFRVCFFPLPGKNPFRYPGYCAEARSERSISSPVHRAWAMEDRPRGYGRHGAANKDLAGIPGREGPRRPDRWRRSAPPARVRLSNPPRLSRFRPVDGWPRQRESGSREPPGFWHPEPARRWSNRQGPPRFLSASGRDRWIT